MFGVTVIAALETVSMVSSTKVKLPILGIVGLSVKSL